MSNTSLTDYEEDWRNFTQTPEEIAQQEEYIRKYYCREKEEKPIIIQKENNNKYIYEHINQPLYTNQLVIEIQREGNTTPDLHAEDFEACRETRKILYRRKESQSTLALHEYLGNDKNGFRRVLYSSTFCKEYGYTKFSFSRAFEALLFDKVLRPTNRIVIGTNGVIGHILIFEKVLEEEDFPNEIYNPKNVSHIEIVKQIKRQCGIPI